MRKIANILTNRKFTEDSTFYNVVSSVDALMPNIPTLVIGWELTKTLYPNANIVDWKIDDDTYFTFGNREKRSIYNERLKEFKKIAIDRFMKSIKYVFINIITADKTEKGDFLRKVVNNTMAKKIYAEGDMLYVYIPFEETVYGVNVYDISYSGKDADNFCDMIYGGTNCESVNVKVGENVSYGIKSDFKKCKYLIPCIVTDNT